VPWNNDRSRHRLLVALRCLGRWRSLLETEESLFVNLDRLMSMLNIPHCVAETLDNDMYAPFFPTVEDIKAKWRAEFTPDMFPEIRDLVIKLNGDAASVRDTIIEAFRKSYFEGIATLASACLHPTDLPMRERLVAVIGRLGRYEAFELQAQMELEILTRIAPTQNIRDAAARALAAIQPNKRPLASNLSPAFVSRVTKLAYSLVESATTGNGAENDNATDPSPPVTESPRSESSRKKGTARARSRREPALPQLVEQEISARLGV
jgi:hypothetical protein